MTDRRRRCHGVRGRPGFLVLDHRDRPDEVAATLAPWMADSSLRYREDIADGLENAPAAVMRVLSGRNQGKRSSS